MNATHLLKKLKSLLDAQGDLPVFVVTGKYEYVLDNIKHAKEGPLPHLDGVQSQSPPERIILECNPSVGIPCVEAARKRMKL